MVREVDQRNFLFFLSDIHPLNVEDYLIGALAQRSSWGAVADRIKYARQADAFVKSLQKLCLYVHVPFCAKICTFCHCPRVLLRRHSEVDAYIEVLRRQMLYFADVYRGMDAGSICFGGGTPSILSAKELMRVMDGVDKAFPAKQRKILFEIHPGSWTASKLSALSSRGLHRISIGVQSLDTKVLKGVARDQTQAKVLWCLRSARDAAIPRVNVDILAGLPGQTVQGLLSDIKIILSEGANEVHLQPYTSFALKELAGAGESVQAFLERRDAMMREGAALLLSSGFVCSGQGGYVCRDKRDVISNGKYLLPHTAFAAFGPSAMGEFPGAVFYRTDAAEHYNDLPGVKVALQDTGYAMSQYAMLAAINGLHEKVFLERFGVPLEAHCGEGLRYLKRLGLLGVTKGCWKFAGKWEFRRVREYTALSRVLFGEKILAQLRARFVNRYDPRQDYSSGGAFLRALTQNWLVTVYYQHRI